MAKYLHLQSANSTSSLLETVKKNVFAPLECDSVIKYIGISTSVQDDIDISAIIQEVGTCLDVYHGINPEYTVAIFCGLTFPYTILEKFKKVIEENQEAIKKSLTSTSETKLSSGVNFLADVQKAATAPQEEKNEVSDVFAKFMKK